MSDVGRIPAASAASIPGELVERLEVAEAGSAELSARIIAALIGPAGCTVSESPFNGAWCIYSGEDRAGRPRLWEAMGPLHKVKKSSPTEDYQAATALAETVLGGCPGWWLGGSLDGNRSNPKRATIVVTADGWPNYVGESPTLPLSICIALLKAARGGYERERVNP